MSHHSIFTSLANQREATAFSWQSALWVSLPPLLLSAVCVLGTSISYLLFHTLAELISIIIALTALVVATTSRRFTRNHFVVFIAVVIGWCAALDLAHTLVFKGMGLTLNNSANPATQIWISARAIQAVALLFAPLFLRRSVRVGWLHLVMGGITLGIGGLIAAGHFPTAYIDGQGLTPFKITSEYVIVALLGVTLWRLWRDRKLMAPTLAGHLAAAVVAMILSELAFTHYVSVYSNANLIGHLFKIFAYWFIYIALVHNTLREPFTMLARAASTYDAVPEPTIVVQTDGTIREANQASEDYTGLQLEQLIGQSSHTLFHDASIPAEHCPVCLRIAQGTATFTQELVQEKGFWAVECSVAPFSGNDPEHAYVQVIRDISQRRQLEAERETLVYNLGERIKELRCLYAISDLIEKPDIDIPSLLKGVIDVLPSAFRFPEQAQAGLVSQWGQFGMAFGDCHNDNTRQLQRPLEVNGATVGTVWVCYPEAMPLDDAPFLPEEQELMDTVALRVSETIENNLAAARLQRLTNFYEMLSATNRAIVHCRSIEQLLVALFEALSAHSTFPMLFIARTNNGQLPFYPVHAYGINDTHLQTLTRTLADPASLIGQILPQLQTGNIVCTAVPPASDDNASEWITYLHAQGITERAIMPLLREGELLGIVGLYATRADAFDQDQLRLLGEMATDMSFALYSLVAEQRRIAAEELATLSEHRFREVFESSPLPMQIHSVTTGTIHAINRAHTKWLGYTLADISNENDWFEHVFVDPDIREQIRQLWQQDLRLAQSSSLIARSPELTLRCKDGSNRIARGTMTVVGNDAVLAWTDLTDIRHGELALRESEQRFRSMIEQTVSGIYVRRDGRYIYVNPRYCEMTGWAAEDLLGKDVLEFTVQDPAVLQSIHAAWDRLAAGERSIAYSVPFRRKDGVLLELGLQAAIINWDNSPATIVMAQDITERKHTEQQIASYVKQLEGSMKATLQAVSNMVDLRDPYTAGHERRVGLIAGAIARELGWEPERCNAMEMTGLVHDIGKIAIPAEILSKPTRLTPLEMAMVRGHAQAGYDILKDVPFAAPVAEAIRQHHERMDGSGYPQGLKGDEILPEARVLAVADVIESMAAHRPYRAALGLNTALAEIEQGKGRLYDTEVAEAALRLVREKGYQLPQ